MVTSNFLEAIRVSALPIKFYNAGSGEVFGNTVLPATEESPVNPVSPYGSAKSSAMALVRLYREVFGLNGDS